MAFLRFLSEWRCPPLDALFSVLTRAGEETAFLAVALLVFWCINKRQGYYLLGIGFIGTLANQALKITCRIPRPWVRDPSFSIVESAREAATGYSFPSGHTQIAVCTYGGIARERGLRKLWRVLLVILIASVSLSRMYLGVHTPADVGVSLLIGAVLVFAFYPFFLYVERHPRAMWYFLGAATACALLFCLYAYLFPFPSDTDAANLAEARKNAQTLLGALLGICVVYPVEANCIRYETKAPLVGQILKLGLGLGCAIGVKSGLKALFALLLPDAFPSDALRYFLLVLFAGLLWPLTFRFFARVGKKPSRGRDNNRNENESLQQNNNGLQNTGDIMREQGDRITVGGAASGGVTSCGAVSGGVISCGAASGGSVREDASSEQPSTSASSAGGTPVRGRAHPLLHFLTITRHRHRVIAFCFRAGIGWQGLRHDLSKYSPTEFIRGARYYIGTRSPNEGERRDKGYSLAWMHHKGRNRHHFEYWTDVDPVTKRYAPVPMPTNYVAEMLCDRVAACRIYRGDAYTVSDPLNYYLRGNAKQEMHPETAALLERWLTLVAEQGEKVAFSVIRREVKEAKKRK